jgi:hypothetical protein
MSLTLLQIASKVALDVGLAVPTAVATSTDREMLEMKQVLDFVGEELSRRVDWSSLRVASSVTGTGAAAAFNLPTAMMRLMSGNAMLVNNVTVRGGLSAEEFLSLASTSGTPRYYFISGAVGAKNIQFWPYLANGVQANFNYQSLNWATNSNVYVLDTDQCQVPDTLMIKGGIARWRRQHGMDYQDYAAEYEASLANYAMFDDNARSP